MPSHPVGLVSSGIVLLRVVSGLRSWSRGTLAGIEVVRIRNELAGEMVRDCRFECFGDDIVCP